MPFRDDIQMGVISRIHNRLEQRIISCYNMQMRWKQTIDIHDQLQSGAIPEMPDMAAKNNFSWHNHYSITRFSSFTFSISLVPTLQHWTWVLVLQDFQRLASALALPLLCIYYCEFWVQSYYFFPKNKNQQQSKGLIVTCFWISPHDQRWGGNGSGLGPALGK